MLILSKFTVSNTKKKLHFRPIWPRTVERAKTLSKLFYDDDNFAYFRNNRDTADAVRYMDRKKNLLRVISFLDNLLL